ncbi:nitrate/nitrite transporter NrtS [Neptunicoccus cionae]|uniref:nitrate/nitrite transporter NrtS n=1 Tax=Neptunicoccus cionae TaxID=2035344 RepID=UPI000C75729A|nr:nitrate/nitrite transporter NrtS [Amylibacter cionae]PLS21250.1 hypothetical protein C0U40_12915 [Amylibacter cionae]
MIHEKDLGFFAIARQRSVVTRALRIAAIVGVVLALINHGDQLVVGAFSIAMLFKITLTFLVPFCVSTYSSVLAVRERLQSI